MITTQNIKTLHPHQLAKELEMKVTHGINDPDKYFREAYYGKFIVLGAFLHVNAERFVPKATMTSLQMM